MSISLQNVVFSYPGHSKPVLCGLSLDICSGETVALMGASGSGKSTIAKLVTALLPPATGTVTLGDEVVKVGRTHPNLSYLVQNASDMTYPWLTVRRNMEYALRLRNVGETERRAFVREASEALNLEHRLGSYPDQLSGGELKRLSLAMTMSYSPQYVLMDEPFSGLDFELARSLWDYVFDRLRRCGAACLLITHSVDEAVILGSAVAILREGVIAAEIRAERYSIPDTERRSLLLTDPSLIAYRNAVLTALTS